LAVARGLGDALQVPLLLRTAKLRTDSASRRSRSITLFAVLAGAALIAAALVPNGYSGLALFTIWGLAWGLCMPGLKASLNSYLSASSRATVLSFGNLLNSLGTGAVLVAISLSTVGLGDVGLTWTVSGLAAAGVGIAGAVLSSRAGRAATQSPEPIMATQPPEPIMAPDTG
jgi:MFS family permease